MDTPASRWNAIKISGMGAGQCNARNHFVSFRDEVFDGGVIIWHTDKGFLMHQRCTLQSARYTGNHVGCKHIGSDHFIERVIIGDIVGFLLPADDLLVFLRGYDYSFSTSFFDG